MTETLHIVTGGVGFVGRALIKNLLQEGHHIVALDNLCRGTLRNVEEFSANPTFTFIQSDLSDPDVAEKAFEAAIASQPHSDVMVWHLAANSDIQAGVTDPQIDLRDTFMTTFSTLRAMRKFGLKRLAFSSTSAVYGAIDAELHEDIGPLFPISNYGAMKLASEAAISAAAEAYLEKVWIFRFPNVIGPYATHGVIYDFSRKLRADATALEVLGNGSQQKAYLMVDELVDAMRLITTKANEKVNYFNIGQPDEGVTVRFIAEETIRVAAPAAKIRFTGGDRGWVGDVPRFRYSIRKLAALGWTPRKTSAETIRAAIPLIWGESE